MTSHRINALYQTAMVMVYATKESVSAIWVGRVKNVTPHRINALYQTSMVMVYVVGESAYVTKASKALLVKKVSA